jgi:hypothetical protein
MTTEWLALWVHFLWSGGLTMLFCLYSWKEIGRMIRGEGSKEANKQRKRLLRVAIMVVICLLIMVSTLLFTASKLEEWNRTADLSRVCFTKETAFSRDMAAYGLDAEMGVTKICSRDEANAIRAQHECLTDCFWHPDITLNGLSCGNGDEDLPHWIRLKANNPEEPGWPVCDCECSSLIKVATPR